MEIGPIPAIRAVSPSKMLKVDPCLANFLDIEQTSPSKEDTFSRGDESASGGQDAEAQEPEQEELSKEEEEDGEPAPTVNLFA
jgi:hypothetical protein